MEGTGSLRYTDGHGRLRRPIPPLRREETERSVPEWFEEIVRAFGSRPAVVAKGIELSYAELNEWANRVARAILALREDPEERVALLVGHRGSSLAAVMGAMKSGKPFVVLDPAYPFRRLLELLDHSGASILVTDRDHAALAEVLGERRGLPHVALENVRESGSGDDLRLAIAPDQPCYLMYTSGSTGKPKGVVTTHRNRIANQLDLSRRVELTERDRLTWLHSLAFAASGSEIFGALLSGATLYPVDLRQDGFQGLARCLEERRISVLQWIPSAFRRFANSLPTGHRFPDLRAILLGSEPVTGTEVELYRGLAADDSLFANRYGSTEAGYSHYYFLERGAPRAAGLLPVGFPTSHRDAVIRGDSGQVLAAGEAGEIWIRSEYLAAGYWRDPSLTAERFRSGGECRERFYRTGDLGRIDADGCLHHLGRIDQQVKISGYRVELAEVEAALAALPGVCDAVAAAATDPDGEQRLVGYVVLEPGVGRDPVRLRRLLGERLPAYLVPSVILSMDAVPLTATGKVLRSALPAPDWTSAALAGGDPPANALERALWAVWQEVLQLEGLGVDQVFFDLGGDSLKATRITNRIQQWTDASISPMIVWDAPTIRSLAELLAHRHPEVVAAVPG